MSAVVEQKMSKTERNELRKIIKNRFNLLHGQIAQRENEIVNQIRERILAENEAKLTEWRDKIRAVNNKVDDAIKAAVEVRDAAVDAGVDVSGFAWERGYPRHGDFRVGVRGLDQKIYAEMQALRTGAGFEKLNLKQMEMDLDEELALGILETDDARSFLQRVPTVDTLLPLPAGDAPKQLAKGSKAKKTT